MYVRHKVIKGHIYYYLVEGHRDGKTVRQKVIRYLGTSLVGYASGTGDTTAPLPTVTPEPAAPPLGTTSPETSETSPARSTGTPPRRTHFIPVIGKEYRTVFTGLFHRFGVSSISYTIPRNSATRGLMYNTANKVRFTARPTAYFMAHELGHRIDYLLNGSTPDGTHSGSKDPAFLARVEEYRKVADYFYAAAPLTSRDRLANFSRWRTQRPDNTRIMRTVSGLTDFYEGYAYQPKECFAHMIALCLVEPRKARQLAPNTYHWLIKTLSEDDNIRQALIDAGCFELGTTHKPSSLAVEETPP